jgi:hypothetical protein
MILSQGRKFIFIHIPKTGGTALSLALEARAMKDDILFDNTPKAKARQHRQKALRAAGRLWKHSTRADIEGLVPDMDSYFTFTLVRNPWDRMVSYYHFLQSKNFDHPAVTLAKSTSFSAFLNAPATQATLRAWPAAAHMRDGLGVERANLYARLEYLQDDLAPLEAHLGFKLPQIARVNASQRDRDWRLYYSDADAALIATLCAEDIARFGYQFDVQL